MAFTHLHVHTEYSLLDGSGKISEMVHQAKELGFDSLAITDHGVMYGCIDFYKACHKEGIKPIIGCEVYVAPGSRHDREAGSTSDERYNHLILLAENDRGYHNLVKIVSRGFTEGFYYRPRVDYEVLEEFHEGIIALSACLAGEVAMHLRRGFYEEAKKSALHLQSVFGEGNFFLELQDHGMSEQKLVNQGLLRLHEETGIELVATNDVHYTFASDAESHDILLCIQTQRKVTDENRMRYEGGQYYLKSEEEMRALFPYAQEALDNTHRIAERCDVTIVFGEYKLPVYPVPEGYSAKSYLRKLCFDGLAKRYGDADDSLKERMEYELSTIESMGFVDYFLIVWDFIKYAKDHGIAVGPGRGSAAGSIVAYCLEITDINPIKYNLLFERFLNPERVTMPDIDVDFCYTRRQEVIDYVSRKYGKEKVVQIVTFGTMAAKMVIRDVGRALDLPYATADQVAKMIPNELGITIEKALKVSKELRDLYEGDEQMRYLIDMSMRLEGLPRHTSMHAAGVVISKEAVDEYVPLSMGGDNAVTTQYTMTTLEELGLLKMDFLGLRTLTVIQSVARMAGVDMEKISYEDANIYNMISAGRCEGVFQLESTGMKNFMKELRPGNIEDVIAGISLYRPGPMDFIPKYIKGKEHPETIVYETPQLAPILEPTYGCIVYQEQVMQIVRDLAGYSYGRSDLVRRAMSKKKADVMERERRNFVYGNPDEGVPGCAAQGIAPEVANHIFDEMTDFARYAFNKSHAAAYAVVAYQTAWLKYYYPVEFMAALMTSVIDAGNKVSEYIQTCRHMGIPILPPDINEGERDFSASGKSIRYALSAIKGLGGPVIESIVAERRRNGPFRTLQDLISRMSGELNKRVIESLIKAGALDTLPGTRRQKMLMYTQIADQTVQDKKRRITGQMSLFDFMGEEEKTQYETQYPDVPDFTKAEKLEFEKEVLGIYVSGHPMQEVEGLWRRNITNTSADFLWNEETMSANVHDGAKAVIGGIMTDKTVKTTKNSQMMAFLTIEDMLGTVETIVFPRDYEKYRPLLETDRKLLVRGRVSAEEDKDSKLIAEEITAFEDLSRELWIQFANLAEYQARAAELRQILDPSDGKDRVILFCREERAIKRLPASRSVQVTEELLGLLRLKFGEKNIAVK
ncbi:MAG: DNA polymerase III subunit alpha [Lachnospiraceae bacterium]|nr:DNA polymerase III subunit alpha [Lachnospiraceae bacterium]